MITTSVQKPENLFLPAPSGFHDKFLSGHDINPIQPLKLL